MKAAVLGVTGYTGSILIRRLADHPAITEILPVSSTRAGKTLSEIDPGLTRETLTKTDEGILLTAEEALQQKPDVVFAALPHLKSAPVLKPFLETSVIIDLSADFRIKNSLWFSQAYKTEMPEPEMAQEAVYGLAEWNREAIKGAQLIANPGCYPTATLLPLLPLIQEKKICGPYIVNALSGISGAGRKAVINNLFVERSENTNAYAPGTSHRHFTEIAKEMLFAGEENAFEQLLFTPHLVPLKRGMAITTAVSLKNNTSAECIETIYNDYYGKAPFISVSSTRPPETADVRGSNRCSLSYRIEGSRLLLFSVIDNLEKGASGQAIQNMNIRFGRPETEGLRTCGEL